MSACFHNKTIKEVRRNKKESRQRTLSELLCPPILLFQPTQIQKSFFLPSADP